MALYGATSKDRSVASFVAQLVKNPPGMRETWVRSVGWEDPLEKGKATHPVLWPGEFHGLYSRWDCKDSVTCTSLKGQEVPLTSLQPYCFPHFSFSNLFRLIFWLGSLELSTEKKNARIMLYWADKTEELNPEDSLSDN